MSGTSLYGVQTPPTQPRKGLIKLYSLFPCLPQTFNLPQIPSDLHQTTKEHVTNTPPSYPAETNSKIHRQFRNAHEGHRSHAGLDPTRASTGVVWCTERAYEHGFADEPEKWANLGQGAPEVDDDIEGSFDRPQTIDISMAGREYGPTAGIKPLRAAVANLYNVHHR